MFRHIVEVIARYLAAGNTLASGARKVAEAKGAAAEYLPDSVNPSSRGQVNSSPGGGLWSAVGSRSPWYLPWRYLH